MPEAAKLSSTDDTRPPPRITIGAGPEEDTTEITVEQASGVFFVFTVPTEPLVPLRAEIPPTARVAGKARL